MVDERLTARVQLRLRRLAACLVLGDDFRPVDAVELAADLVADGVAGDAVIELASRTTDATQLDGYEVETLFRGVLTEAGIEVPTRDAAAWVIARWMAEMIIAGAVSPPAGASRIWGLWRECGNPAEFGEMLQLLEAWETSVGAARIDAEAELKGCAPRIVAAADRALQP